MRGRGQAAGLPSVTEEPIPLVDLKIQHQGIADEVHKGWGSVLGATSFILGADVAIFEGAFAEFSGTRHCVGVGNGTDALELAVRAAGIGPGDEVIVPTNTFIASALAVVRAGARPVLVDVDPVSYLLDVEQVRDCLGPRTVAIMPVHLYGQVAPMEELVVLAERAGVTIIEDAAQAHGALRKEAPAGSFGLAAGTSFYPGKNLGAYGDGGAVLTNSDEIARKVRALRNYGGEKKYEHPEVGFNSRLDTLQAVVLRVKLRHLARWNAARREAADRYDRLLEGLEGVTRPEVCPGNEHVWHLYVVRVPRRDKVLAMLKDARIGAGIHYPIPLHLQGAFLDLGYRQGAFPVAEAAAKEILSLPMFPEITPAQQERVVEELAEALRT